jgi:hypothetical protein
MLALGFLAVLGVGVVAALHPPGVRHTGGHMCAPLARLPDPDKLEVKRDWSRTCEVQDGSGSLLFC